MNEILQKQIAGLNKSTQNVTNARNAAQRDAAETFLAGRARDLEAIQSELAKWLADADAYINANMPDIDDDPNHEYNRQWLDKLQDYQDVSKALDAAWSAFKEARAAA